MAQLMTLSFPFLLFHTLSLSFFFSFCFLSLTTALFVFFPVLSFSFLFFVLSSPLLSCPFPLLSFSFLPSLLLSPSFLGLRGEDLWSGQCVLLCHFRSRCRFHELREREGTPLQLTLNYDQTWINCFREPRTVLQRKRHRVGKNDARITKLCGGRRGLTMCTSTWASGEKGPLFLSVGPNSLPAKYIREANQMLCKFWEAF